MVNKKVSVLTAVSGISISQEFPVNDVGTSEKVTPVQVGAFRNASPAFVGTPTAPTAANDTNTTQLATTAFVQSGGPVKVKNLTANQSNADSAMVRVSGMDVTVPSGTYVFEYYIRAQTSVTSNSLKFSVNHTGTTTTFVYNLTWPSVGVTDSTGTVDHEGAAVTTGSVYSYQATRVINTTLGPQVGIDNANVDTLFRITGLMVVTVSGTLQLFHGSEVAGVTSTIMAGTGLILTKVA